MPSLHVNLGGKVKHTKTHKNNCVKYPAVSRLCFVPFLDQEGFPTDST